MYQMQRPNWRRYTHSERLPPSLQIRRTLKVQDVNFFTTTSITNWLKYGLSSSFPAKFLVGAWWAWRARNSTCIANYTIPLFEIEMEVIRMANINVGYLNQAT